jgi:hypothetical protein
MVSNLIGCRKETMMRNPLKILVMTATLLSSGLALAEGSRGFEGQIAGTYLSTSADDALILQLDGDGNVTVIFALQFLNLGVIGEDFSNSKGHWKRAGGRRIVANTVDIAFDEGMLIGVAAARYVIEFDRHLRKARLNCTGAIYAPGVDPFSRDAEPLPETEFACNEFILERVL